MVAGDIDAGLKTTMSQKIAEYTTRAVQIENQQKVLKASIESISSDPPSTQEDR